MATLSVGGDPEAWLPPKPEFTFPSEFPYEFDSSPDTDSGDDEDVFFAGLTRRLTQQLSFKSQKNRVVVGSPESTLNGVGSLSVSSNGSPNGASSPTAPTPCGVKNDTWDLIYAAAGQVARMKMTSSSNNGVEAGNKCSINYPGVPTSNRAQNPSYGSVYSVGHNIPQRMGGQYEQLRQEQAAAPKGQWPSVWERQQQQQEKAVNWQKFLPPQPQPQPQISCGKASGGYETGRFVVARPQAQSGWPPLQTNRPQYHQQNQAVGRQNAGTRAAAGVFVGGGYGTSNKRECAGTGVFLPRRYSNPPPVDSKKKTSSACSTVLLPAKVVHALNLNLDDAVTCNGRPQPLPQPRFNASFAADYAALLARRNAALLSHQQQQQQQKRSSGFISHEVGGLPQEWTY